MTLTLNLTDADYAFYETFQKQVETFGLANAFEDRADRNRYRAIDKVLNTEKVPTGKVTKPAKTSAKYTNWNDTEWRALVGAYLRHTSGGSVNRKAVIAEHQAAFPFRTEGAVGIGISQLCGIDVESPANDVLTMNPGARIVASEVNPLRFPLDASLDTLLAAVRA
jgi:hypothetical protein